MVETRALLPFVHRFVERVIDETGAKLVVLFGSFARREAGPTSDIDLMVECPTRDRDRVLRIADEVNESIMGAGYKNVIKPLPLEEADSDILSQGTILWGRAVITPEGLRRKVLITYDMRRLQNPEKVRLCIALYGHRTEKRHGKKVYVSHKEGVVRALGAAKIEGILVDIERLDEIEATLKGFKVPYKIIEIYQK